MKLKFKIAAISQASWCSKARWEGILRNMGELISERKGGLFETEPPRLNAILNEMNDALARVSDMALIDLGHQTIQNFSTQFNINIKDTTMMGKSDFIVATQESIYLGLAALAERQLKKEEAAAQIAKIDLSLGLEKLAWVNKVGQLFWPAFDITQIQAKGSSIRQRIVERQIKEALHKLVYAEVGNLYRGNLPTSADFSAESQMMLSIILAAEGGTIEGSLPEKYLQMIAFASESIVNPSLFLAFIADGPEGKALDAEITKADTAFQTELRNLVRLMRRDDGNLRQKNHWRLAERRIGECVQYLNQEKDLSAKNKTDLADFFKTKKEELEGVCCVGLNFQLLSLKSEICLVIDKAKGDKSEEALLSKQQYEYLKDRISHALAKNRIKESTDVHAVNYVISFILSLTKEGVPESLKDPYITGFKSEIDRNKTAIMDHVLNAGDFLSQILKNESTYDLSISRLSPLLSRLSWTREKKKAIAKKVLSKIFKLPDSVWQNYLSRTETISSVSEVLIQLDKSMKDMGEEMGLWPSLVHSGNEALFKTALTILMLKMEDIPRKSYVYLLDQAVLGGSVEILKALGGNEATMYQMIRDQPYAIAFITESSSALMMAYLVSALPEAVQWKYLATYRPAGWGTVLMRVKTTEMAEVLMAHLKKSAPTEEAYKEYLNKGDYRGRTVLGHVAEQPQLLAILEKLIKEGAILESYTGGTMSPLSLAAARKNIEFIAMSLDLVKEKSLIEYNRIIEFNIKALAIYAWKIIKEDVKAKGLIYIQRDIDALQDVMRLNGRVFEEMMKPFTPSEHLTLLQTRTSTPEQTTLAHDMARYKSALLLQWLGDNPDFERLGVLALRTAGGGSVWRALIMHNPYHAKQLCLRCKCLDERMNILRIEDPIIFLETLSQKSMRSLEFLVEKEDAASLKALVSQVKDMTAFLKVLDPISQEKIRPHCSFSIVETGDSDDEDQASDPGDLSSGRKRGRMGGSDE